MKKEENKNNTDVTAGRRSSNIAVRCIIYFFGLLIMTLGVAVSVKSDLGVSPVSSIPYTMTCVWGHRDGKGNDRFPCGTGAGAGDIAATRVPDQESAADTRGGAVRIHDDVFKSSDDVPA